jgi:hypothetical protein
MTATSARPDDAVYRFALIGAPRCRLSPAGCRMSAPTSPGAA